MLNEVFFQALGRVEAMSSRDSGDAVLRSIRDLYGLSSVAYLCVNLPDNNARGNYFQGTYSDTWVHYYKTKHLASIDPVVRLGLNSLLPLDWDELREKHPESRIVFREAANHGLGTKGLTFPIRGTQGETALFSITTASTRDAEWQRQKKLLIRDVQVFATYYHNKILERNGHKTFTLLEGLSAREKDCLKYIASGETNQTTADKLKITERTVRFHLENARSKLNCLTTTQAVAKAIALGLLTQM